MLNPVAMSIISNTFTDPRERARAIGVWGAVIGVSMAPGPLIDVRFFRSVPFAAATGIAVCAFGAVAGFHFLNTMYLQDLRGFSPLVAGSLLLTGLGADTPLAWLLPAYVLIGLGFGLVNAPITNTAVTGMPQSRAGVAAGIASTSRQIGQSLGVAVIGSLAAVHVAGRPAVVDPTSAAGWWTIVAAGIGVLVLGVASTGARARGHSSQPPTREPSGKSVGSAGPSP